MDIPFYFIWWQSCLQLRRRSDRGAHLGVDFAKGEDEASTSTECFLTVEIGNDESSVKSLQS